MPGPAEVCGHVDMQGFDVVLECIRQPHDDPRHLTEIGQQWICEGVEDHG